MAKFSVVRLDDLQGMLRLKAGLPKEVVRQVGDVIGPGIAEKVEKIANAHYENLFREIGFKLKGLGMPLATTSGTHRLSFGVVGGNVKAITTSAWPALTDPYRKRKVKSLTFWRKQGDLDRAYQAQVRKNAKVEVHEEKAKRNHHKNRVNIQLLMKFSKVPFPFDTAVSEPFIEMNRRFPPGDIFTIQLPGRFKPSYNRSSLARAQFPEYNQNAVSRPFLRRMAAFLGKDMRRDMVVKLRKL
jgi:hypothetical protein